MEICTWWYWPSDTPSLQATQSQQRPFLTVAFVLASINTLHAGMTLRNRAHTDTLHGAAVGIMNMAGDDHLYAMMRLGLAPVLL